VVVAALAIVELVYRVVKRAAAARRLCGLGPRKGPRNAEELDVEVWQEMEKDPAVREMLEEHSKGRIRGGLG
jgi:phospholipid-translocating ATPase